MQNILLKYKSFLYYLALIILLTFFLIIFKASLDIILITLIISLTFFVSFSVFLKFELISKLYYLRKQIQLVSKSDSISTENNYEEKISELNKILEELSNKEKLFKVNNEVYELYVDIILVIKRIINELNTAKIFKINRNEFLGNVTHELRTPIFAIQLSLETLLDGAVNDENVNIDFLKRALNQTTRLTELVDDLIEISRLETDMKISKRYFEINRFIYDIKNELSELSKKRKIEIKIESEVSDKTRAFGDEERLKQVIINLIDNAIKYTNEDGEIKIGITKTEKDVLISVSDNGVGIPKDDLPRIFERFYRVDKTRSRDMGGSGLGLSIVKHILELHNSAIKVESDEGKGTRFEFNLP
ncbi:MAG: ATP-binding protein, partial [Ignavibacteriae bacterium]|nr:ATP-binding protein [Ignavibacteriota bacterium]